MKRVGWYNSQIFIVKSQETSNVPVCQLIMVSSFLNVHIVVPDAPKYITNKLDKKSTTTSILETKSKITRMEVDCCSLNLICDRMSEHQNIHSDEAFNLLVISSF